MKTHTNNFKEQIKTIGKEIDSKISYGDIVLGKNDLNAVTPSYQGAILKSVMKQLDIDSNVEIPLGTILKYEFGLKVNGEYEYINFGNYVVYSVEKQEDTNSYKIVCYDKLLYSMLDYVKLPITYPISIRDYINAISTALGLTFANKNDTFANYDKQIQSDLYNGLGYTFRDVLDELAQVTASTICLNENDELEIRYITETNDVIDEEFLKDVNVNFGEKFGPINTIVLSRSAGSDNIYYPENLPDEPYELKISDNQIMNGNNRVDFLPDIYNKLNGLEFYTNDFISTGICYYDLCDRYSVRVGENIYSCVMFNDEVLVTQGLEENIFTEKPEETTIDYTKADKTDRKINQVSLIVDKQNQTIQSIASKVEDISKKITGNGSITLENAYEGQLHKLTIKGNISLIYPNNNLFPSSSLYAKSFKLQVDETIYELDLNYLNYINSNICDEFVYENGNCYIIRRVGIDENGEMYQLSNEILEEKNDLIINVLKESTITLLGFDNAILSAEYLLQNQYTDVFATEAYVNSEIKQTADEINIEVAKKVNEDEVVNTINVSTEQITLKGNRLVVEADNFELDSEGNMICKNASFVDGSINTNKDLIVGDNAYIGQNQLSEYSGAKYLYFSDNAYIRRMLYESGSYMNMHSTFNTRLDCNNSTNINVMQDRIQMSHTPTITSDIRKKQNIKDIDVSWINNLKVKEFEYIKTPKQKQIGLIAQDYIENDFSKYFLQKDDEGYYSINYGNITNALIKYCQNLEKEIQRLKEMIK